MALLDHRVFRVGDEWWAAQVHGGVGAGAGRIPDVQWETVYFTSLTNEDANSRAATISAHKLLRLSHSALVAIWEKADRFDWRFEMHAYNMPDADELRRWPVVEDEEGLRWVARQTQVVRADKQGKPHVVSAIELICLDDSALRKEILLDDASTYTALIQATGKTGLLELIREVKALYEDEVDTLDEA